MPLPVAFPADLFTTSEQEQVLRLLEGWSREQKLWLRDMLAHDESDAIRSNVQEDVVGYTVLFGSETGNCESIAHELHRRMSEMQLPGRVASMADYRFREIKKERFLIIACSTHGDGEPPWPATGFFESLMGARAPELPNLGYAVLALGDSSYEHFCKAGIDLDQRLRDLGATPLVERRECDIDFDSEADAWLTEMTRLVAEKLPVGGAPLTPTIGNGPPTGAAGGSYNRNTPFSAAVLANLRLGGRRSDKSTRHLEIDLSGSNIRYEPGDSLGVMPKNRSSEIRALLEAVQFHGTEIVRFRDQIAPLDMLLTSTVEIQKLTLKNVRRWGELATSDELDSIIADQRSLSDFVEGNHLVDLVRLFPAPNLTPQQFIDLMVPLQPRYYSIASSMAIVEEEAHLVVTQLRYDLNGSDRHGIASNYLATDELRQLDVFLHPNPRFRLPADDTTPIIMIGAGTGVAPYRAFMQEREARGADGENWLFFGDRRFHEDFLYQTEWQRWHRTGLLSRIDLAFSRDGKEKQYVQGRLIEQGRLVYEWLESGAHLYLCGDANRMAKGVDKALSLIVAKHGGMRPPDANGYIKALERESRLQRDVY